MSVKKIGAIAAAAVAVSFLASCATAPAAADPGNQVLFWEFPGFTTAGDEIAMMDAGLAQGNDSIIVEGSSLQITQRAANWAGVDFLIPVQPGDRVEITASMSVSLQGFPPEANWAVAQGSGGVFSISHLVTMSSPRIRIATNHAPGNNANFTVTSVRVYRAP